MRRMCYIWDVCVRYETYVLDMRRPCASRRKTIPAPPFFRYSEGKNPPNINCNRFNWNAWTPTLGKSQYRRTLSYPPLRGTIWAKSGWLHCAALDLSLKVPYSVHTVLLRVFCGSQKKKQRLSPYTIHTGFTTQMLCVVCAVRNEYCKIMFSILPRLAGLCHHGMARPRVADRGTASSMEDSCEYIE